MAKPMIIIAPGSFSLATEYDALISHLASSGYEACAYHLPTTLNKPGQHASTLYEDAQFFAGVCAALCDQSQNVVVLGHSYGGMVISEAVKGLLEKRVGKGRVLGMVYLTACAVREGQSLTKAAEGADLSFIGVDGDFMYMSDLELSGRTNYSDLPVDKAIENAKRFTYHSAQSFSNELQYAGYKDVDNVAYIFCTEDKTLVPEFQQTQIDNINESRKGTGKGEAKVFKLATGHVPTASAPVDVARAVVEAINAFD